MIAVVMGWEVGRLTLILQTVVMVVVMVRGQYGGG